MVNEVATVDLLSFTETMIDARARLMVVEHDRVRASQRSQWHGDAAQVWRRGRCVRVWRWKIAVCADNRREERRGAVGRLRRGQGSQQRRDLRTVAHLLLQNLAASICRSAIDREASQQLAIGPALIRAEEEGLVLDYRAANRAAELVLIAARRVGKAGGFVQIAASVEDVVVIEQEG